MKNTIFWDFTPCGSSKNLTFRRNVIVHFRGVLQLLVTTNVVPSSPVLSTLMMEAILSSETSV
jgi:hypothetical protein